MRQKLSVLFCFFILAAWFSGCSRADDNTAADLNLLNTSVAELDGTIYFMTDDRKDLYALEETQGGTTARMVLKDIQANSIASHGAYLYFYRCNSTETAVYYLPVDGGSYQPIQLENFNRRIDSWNGELGDDKWTYMCIIGDYIYLDAYEMGFLSTHITLTSDQPVLEIEHLPAQESSALSTVHWMRTNFVMQSDTPYWTLSSNHTPIREVYLSNYDDTYYYFVTEDGCQRFNYTVSDPNRPLAEHQEKWEEIEAYFPNRCNAKLDIIGDWIYYNYGETGKARVNRQDLTQHEVLLPA